MLLKRVAVSEIQSASPVITIRDPFVCSKATPRSLRTKLSLVTSENVGEFGLKFLRFMSIKPNSVVEIRGVAVKGESGKFNIPTLLAHGITTLLTSPPILLSTTSALTQYGYGR